MIHFPIDPTIYFVLAIHCFMGGIAAVIAQSKGRNLGNWLVVGLIGGTAAVIAAIVLKSTPRGEQTAPQQKG